MFAISQHPSQQHPSIQLWGVWIPAKMLPAAICSSKWQLSGAAGRHQGTLYPSTVLCLQMDSGFEKSNHHMSVGLILDSWGFPGLLRIVFLGLLCSHLAKSHILWVHAICHSHSSKKSYFPHRPEQTQRHRTVRKECTLTGQVSQGLQGKSVRS